MKLNLTKIWSMIGVLTMSLYCLSSSAAFPNYTSIAVSELCRVTLPYGLTRKELLHLANRAAVNDGDIIVKVDGVPPNPINNLKSGMYLDPIVVIQLLNQRNPVTNIQFASDSDIAQSLKADHVIGIQLYINIDGSQGMNVYFRNHDLNIGFNFPRNQPGVIAYPHAHQGYKCRDRRTGQ